MTLRQNAEKASILEPLSQERLEQTVALANRVFPPSEEEVGTEQAADAMFRASLNPSDYRDALDKADIESLNYWTALRDNKVVGVTGLYRQHSDPEGVGQLGWYCVSPDARGRGVGRQLLDRSTQEARQRGYDKLRIWTSTHESEAAAQKLFEEAGFRVTAVEKHPEGSYDILHREKQIDPEKFSIEATLARLKSKSRFKRENNESPNTAIESNGERYTIETIDRADHPDIPKVQKLFETTFGTEEVDPEEVLRSAIEGQTPWGIPDITKYRVYALKDVAGEVVSVIAGGRLDLKYSKEPSGKQMFMIGYAVTDPKMQEAGLATEAYISAIMHASEEARRDGKELAFAAGECTHTSEKFWNSLGWKRVYSADQGTPGSYTELKYVQPALDFDEKTGKVAEGAGIAPEHIMIDSFQGAPPSKDDILATVRAFYEWCNTWPKEAFTGEQDNPNAEALAEHQRHVLGIWNDFKKQVTEGGPLSYLTNEEREAAIKANVHIIAHDAADHGNGGKEDF